MHPIEHAIYFSTILLFFFIPAHPVHMINLASRLGLAPAQGHTGFDRLLLGEESSMDVSYYAHYLHHKYFEVNYSDGMIPLLAQSENVPFLQSENVPLMVMNREGVGDGVWSVDDERWRA
jgi:hypothetical protein